MSEPADQRHSLAEDLHALSLGLSFVAFGILLLKSAGLTTGGIAGLALVIGRFSGWSVGLLLFLLSAPFFLLASRRMGWVFTMRSILAVAVVSFATAVLPGFIGVNWIDPVFAALFGGSMIGMGILAVARHRAGIGGVGVLALYLYQTRGINAGKTMLVADALILALAIPILDPTRFWLSVLSAAALDIVMLTYHRPGRYAGY